MTYDEAIAIQPKNIREAEEAFRILDLHVGPSVELKKVLLWVQIREMLDVEKGKAKRKRVKNLTIPMEGFYDHRNRDNPMAESSYVLLQPDEVPDDNGPVQIQSVITEDKGSG